MQQPKSLEGWRQIKSQVGESIFLDSNGTEVWAPPYSKTPNWLYTSEGKLKQLCGTLRIGIYEATQLTSSDAMYLVLSTDQTGNLKKKATTSTKGSKTSQPEWFEYYDVSVDYGRFLHLSIRHSSRFTFGSGEEIAWGIIDLIPVSDGLDHMINLNVLPKGNVRIKVAFDNESGIFGLDIAACVHREKRNFSSIPLIVEMCIKAVEKDGMDNLGMYRLCGSKSSVDALKDRFNKAGDLTKTSFGAEGQDINNIGSLLKQYFRDLPEPLFTYGKYPDFIAALMLQQPTASVAEKVDRFAKVLLSLPSVNRATIVYLFNHLHALSQLSSQNKMGPQNIGTCFGPSLLSPPPTVLKKRREGKIAPKKPSGVAGLIDPTETAELASQSSIVEFLVQNWVQVKAKLENPQSTPTSPSPLVSRAKLESPIASTVGTSSKPANAATVDRNALTKQFSSSENLSLALSLFDKQKLSAINASQFRDLCVTLGVPASKIPIIFAELDKDGNGVISREEFASLEGIIELTAAQDSGFSVRRKKPATATNSSGNLPRAVAASRSASEVAPQSALSTANGKEKALPLSLNSLSVQDEAALDQAPLTPGLSSNSDADADAAIQQKHIRMIFSRYDTDGSGSIDRDEFKNLCYGMGHCFSDDELEIAMKRLDKDGNGEISFSEFAEWWTNEDRFSSLRLQGTSLANMQRAVAYFQHFDVDRSGTLTADEFYELHADLSNYGFQLNDPLETLKELDPNNIGRVPFNTYIQWLIKIGSLELDDEIEEDDIPDTAV